MLAYAKPVGWRGRAVTTRVQAAAYASAIAAESV